MDALIWNDTSHETLLNLKWLTLSLVPLAPVESARSLPAKSTKLILLTCLRTKMLCLRTVKRSNAHTSKFSNCQTAIVHQGCLNCRESTHRLLHSSLFLIRQSHILNNAKHSYIWRPGGKGCRRGCGTFSDVFSESLSCRFCVKMMLNTAWERLLVSFMLVAATVLRMNSMISKSDAVVNWFVQFQCLT